MKRLFTLLFLALSFCGFAQVTNVQDSLFPKISFDYSEYGIVQRTYADFSLIENEQNVPFAMTELRSKRTKTVLFLWEDMASHSGQFKAFKQILTSFFSVDKKNGDKFNVAVFNRRPFNAKSGGQNWHLLSDKFLSGNEMLDKINLYERSTELYQKEPLAADLYASIDDALEFINKNKDDDKMIVLMTAGLNVELAGATRERASFEEDAKKANIPIYVVYYPYSGNKHITPNITGIAKNTYGKVISAENTAEAVRQLVESYTNLNTRSYRFNFTTNQKRDGRQHAITLQTSNEKSEQVHFHAPYMTLELRIKESPWLFVGFIAAFIGLLALIFWLIRRSIVARNRKIAESEAMLKGEISASNQAVENIKKQQKIKEQQQQAELERKAREEEEERLTRLMHTKNLFPRLQCRVGNNSFTYNINKIRTTIGRKGYNNDVELDNDKVSRQHAEIIFTGGGFEIIDKKSANKVIVNGQFFERTTLKSGDTIGLGEAVITFYV